MSAFNDVLQGGSEYFVKALYRVLSSDSFKTMQSTRVLAASLRLREEQFICAFGFNPNRHEFTDITITLGFADISELEARRNEIFAHDVYEKVALADILATYAVLKSHPDSLPELQPLLVRRFQAIESKLEKLVNPRLLNCHRAELEDVYRGQIAQIEFAEARLAAVDNGFRGMVNEVLLIADTRLVPAGDIFYRNTVLPHEKRRLLERGLIPESMVMARLQEAKLSSQERRVLESYLASNAGSTFE